MAAGVRREVGWRGGSTGSGQWCVLGQQGGAPVAGVIGASGRTRSRAVVWCRSPERLKEGRDAPAVDGRRTV